MKRSEVVFMGLGTVDLALSLFLVGDPPLSLESTKVFFGSFTHSYTLNIFIVYKTVMNWVVIKLFSYLQNNVNMLPDKIPPDASMD